MTITEHTINDALATVLQGSRRAWRKDVVHSENLGMLRNSTGRPDILVIEPLVSPVAIETEVLPAATVEPDAKSRLGESLKRSGAKILSSVAVRLPKRFRALDGEALRNMLSDSRDLEMALFTGLSPDSVSRWPKNDWLKGGVSDLSLLTQAASVPPAVIDEAANELMEGIQQGAALFADVAEAHAGAIQRISEELRQENGLQTWRMAAAIVANAFVFHESLAGGPGALRKVLSLDELAGKKALTKPGILAEWRKILDVNYWSIFDIARRILEHTPGPIGKQLVGAMAQTATRLLERQLMRSHDLTGAVFQRLIADRKFLAAYYTTPPSAALLASLAIRENQSPAGTQWGDSNALKAMRIGDFACGTGTLLSAAYQRVGQFHELAGGDASVLHSHMMGGSLVGCDVLPAAAHLTAASLASVHPTLTYAESSILTLAYGIQPNGNVALGSWNLLDAQRRFEILAITAKAAQGTNEKTEDIWSSIPHYGFDLVIMNPPFTRPTGHEGEKIGVRNPMFAAFQTNAATQKLMAEAAARLTKDTNYHGNAGEASAFLLIGHRKLKVGGTLAMVLPLSFMLGEAWAESRELIARNYRNLMLVTNAGVDGSDVSFSSDTDMGECLLIGEKAVEGSSRAFFVTVNERPDTTLTGAGLASSILNVIARQRFRSLEEGPVGGTPVALGKEVLGHCLDAPLPQGWQLARARDFAVAQTAFQLVSKGRIWLPGLEEADTLSVPMSTIIRIGKIGPYHADINGRTAAGGIRGPFEVIELQQGVAPTYPVLWSHDAERERTISFEGECECVPRVGRDADEQRQIDAKVKLLASTASHSHFNRDFRFNSQSTAMQYSRRRTIGGRAWLSISLPSARHERALTLWMNTSLGILLYWWFANKQQAGRGSIGKWALENMAVLDVLKLSKEQLDETDKIFDEMKGISLLPIHAMSEDEGRKFLDDSFMVRVLKAPKKFQINEGPMVLFREKLAKEPSVVGHK